MKLPRLMAIVDADVAQSAGWPVNDLASAFLTAGVTLMQLRAKAAPGGWLFDAASAIVALAHQSNARVIINDRADIARLSGADGVHVGQDDLAPALVRLLVSEQTMVGFSTHTREQVDVVVGQQVGPASPVSYVAVGPVFDTRTKQSVYRAIGLDGVAEAARATRAAGLPLVAIGGITLETAPAVIGAGADSVAVISDLLLDGRPEARVRAYIERLTV